MDRQVWFWFDWGEQGDLLVREADPKLWEQKFNCLNSKCVFLGSQTPLWVNHSSRPPRSACSAYAKQLFLDCIAYASIIRPFWIWCETALYKQAQACLYFCAQKCLTVNWFLSSGFVNACATNQTFFISHPPVTVTCNILTPALFGSVFSFKRTYWTIFFFSIEFV